MFNNREGEFIRVTGSSGEVYYSVRVSDLQLGFADKLMTAEEFATMMRDRGGGDIIFTEELDS